MFHTMNKFHKEICVKKMILIKIYKIILIHMDRLQKSNTSKSFTTYNKQIKSTTNFLL